MRLLSNEEVEELYRESDIAKLSWFSWQGIIAKAQQELTNKEWVEWIEENMWKQGSIERWKAHLKEIGL